MFCALICTYNDRTAFLHNTDVYMVKQLNMKLIDANPDASVPSVQMGFVGRNHSV